MFGGITGLVIICIVMAVVQISAFTVLPRVIRNILALWPILGFLINIGLSCLVMAFTGTASFVGSANLVGSIIFGIYLLWYKKKYGINSFGAAIKLRRI